MFQILFVKQGEYGLTFKSTLTGETSLLCWVDVYVTTLGQRYVITTLPAHQGVTLSIESFYSNHEV